MKGIRDVQGALVSGGFTIELLFFLAKARKILNFLHKHRDLNPIGSTANLSRF
jgi:hypothetical protein